MPRVFVSYSHDSPDHTRAVLALANDLRSNGIDAVIDQYVSFPEQGWPRWMMEQIEQADFVVVVCTETYRRRAEGREDPSRGLGANWEGQLITQLLYEAGMRNTRFLPIALDRNDESRVPMFLRQYTRFDLSTLGGREDLLRLLLGRPAIVMPPLGRAPDLSTGSGPGTAAVVQQPHEPGGPRSPDGALLRHATPAAESLGQQWFELADQAFQRLNAVHSSGNFAWLRGDAFGDFVFYTDGSPAPWRVGLVSEAGLNRARSQLRDSTELNFRDHSLFALAGRIWGIMYDAIERPRADPEGVLSGYAISVVRAGGLPATEIRALLAGWDVAAARMAATVAILAASESVQVPSPDAKNWHLGDYGAALLRLVGTPEAALQVYLEQWTDAVASLVTSVAHIRSTEAGKLPEIHLLLDQWINSLVGPLDLSRRREQEYAFTVWGMSPDAGARIHQLVHRLAFRQDPLVGA